MEELTGSWKKHVDFNYLCGEDFGDKVVEMTIKNAVKESAFDPNSKKQKDVTVLHFNETDKGVILNLTNSRTINRLLKTDLFEEWIGKKIKLYGKPDRRFGQVIRIKED